MPLTEIVLLATAFLAYVLGLGLWIGRCYLRMGHAHPWLDPMPAWRRLAFEPTFAFVATLPIPIGLAVLALRAALIAGGR